MYSIHYKSVEHTGKHSHFTEFFVLKTPLGHDTQITFTFVII